MRDCLKCGRTLEELTLVELRLFSRRFDAGALALLLPDRAVARKRSRGSTAPREVARALRTWRKKLGIGNA
ncbi:MAG: hypothetical protein NT045_00770 [Candidatus Aureabacteria bacterium]|nr:hypothetical protein [Candidatus Auribacterota bacterium]